MEFDKLVDHILTETREAPEGKHYTKSGNLRSGDADADGDGGPKFRSDPTDRKNYGPREDAEDQDEFSFMSKSKRDTSMRDIERDIEKRSLGELIRIYGEDNVRRYFDMEYHDERELREGMDEDAEGKIDKDRMACNKPRRTSGGSKKFVVKACKDGKEKIVRYGDPNMKIKKSNPKRRKSFRARHKCDQKKDKFSAGYWSCKKW